MVKTPSLGLSDKGIRANLANTLKMKKENEICDDLSVNLNKWKTSVGLDEQVTMCFVMVTPTTQMLMRVAVMDVYAALCEMKTWWRADKTLDL